VVAADRGDPPLWAEVDVELDVVDRNNKPPLWDLTNYGPIFVKENVTVGTVVTSVKARSVLIKQNFHACGRKTTQNAWRNHGQIQRFIYPLPHTFPTHFTQTIRRKETWA
jgi:hypothetical protein